MKSFSGPEASWGLFGSGDGVESVFFQVLERLLGLLQPYSAVLEKFPLMCSSCLLTRKMRGVSASWAGNDGQTVIASWWLISDRRGTGVLNILLFLEWVCHGDPLDCFVGSVSAHGVTATAYMGDAGNQMRIQPWLMGFLPCISLVVLVWQFCSCLGWGPGWGIRTTQVTGVSERPHLELLQTVQPALPTKLRTASLLWLFLPWGTDFHVCVGFLSFSCTAFLAGSRLQSTCLSSMEGGRTEQQMVSGTLKGSC